MANAGMTNSRHRARILFIMVAFIILAAVMIGRLAYWQLYKSTWLEDKALSQWTLSIPVQPRRGNIVDCKGRTLAINTNADTIAAIPKQIANPEQTARVLAPILDMSVEALTSRLSQNKSQIYIKRLVEPDVSAQIQEQNLQGIIIVKESKRFYPNGSLAAHALGFSGIDQGWAGLELQYDSVLQGKTGIMQFGADENGQKTNSVGYVKPEDGNQIELTIDIAIQSIIELNLERALVQNQAEAVMGIAMDVKTGGILGMAGKPDFDPNSYQDFDESLWRNPLISDVFEPGSTFKIVTMAAALEENVVGPGDYFYDPGYINVAGVKIDCWKYGGHGSQSYIEIIQNSCNPGFVQLGQRLGATKLHKYIVDFGFTEKTLIDLPGEGKGIMFRVEDMGPVELATTAFGQGPAVTPLQQVRAICAIANQGLMTTPHLVKKIYDKDDNEVFSFADTNTKQVISSETAEEMCYLLESVVSEGTGNRAYIEGYRIAGKTGTAQVPKEGGGYYSNKYISSFIGFAPADDPQIALYVAIRDPKSSYGYYGGVIAAPLFGDIMRDVLRYLDVPTQIDSEKPHVNTGIEVPDVLGLDAETAAAQLWAKNFISEREGPENGVVISQTPAPGIVLQQGQRVVIKTVGKSSNTDSLDVIVPDVMGLSIREAGNNLGIQGLRIDISGSGIAVEQDPPPGEKVRRHSVVTVRFEAR